MKIAFISQGMGRIKPPLVAGSISIWTYEVANELAKSQTVLAYEMEGDLFRWTTKEHQGVTYHYVPTFLNTKLNRINRAIFRLEKRFTDRNSVSRRRIFSSLLHNLGYILLVALDLRKQCLDVVHIHQFSQYVPIIRFFNRRIKIVLHMNCEWLTQLDKSLMGMRIRKADLILGCSDYITEKIRRAFPEYADKAKTVYNGVDHSRFLPGNHIEHVGNSDGSNLLFVGRVSPEKGIHVLIDALKKLVKDYPSIHLSIVGAPSPAPREFIVALSDDPKVQALSRFYKSPPANIPYYHHCLLRQLDDGLKQHVSFHGGVPFREVIGFYQKADILINPSFSESFGMSLAEAMASEKPVVATRVGGMVNVVRDGENGLLVEPGDSDALAQAIRGLMENPELRRRMGRAGRQRVLRKFTWERVAATLLTEYRTLF